MKNPTENSRQVIADFRTGKINVAAALRILMDLGIPPRHAVRQILAPGEWVDIDEPDTNEVFFLSEKDEPSFILSKLTYSKKPPRLSTEEWNFLWDCCWHDWGRDLRGIKRGKAKTMKQAIEILEKARTQDEALAFAKIIGVSYAFFRIGGCIDLNEVEATIRRLMKGEVSEKCIQTLIDFKSHEISIEEARAIFQEEGSDLDQALDILEENEMQ